MNEKAISRPFYATQPGPCPYLPGRVEQRIVTPFSPTDGPALFDHLNRAGFRRSHGFLYRPACPGCHACVPVRVVVDRFVASRRFRKVRNRNADLAAVCLPAVSSDEQYVLFKRYLEARHDDGGMARMTRDEYAELVERATAETFLVEFRQSDTLVAVAITDRLLSGLSGVYTFFDPALASRSLGTYTILWHITETARLKLPFFYLGYWIEGTRKMRYKTQFHPIEQLTPTGWRELPAETAIDG